jgi:hypothetical protein
VRTNRMTRVGLAAFGLMAVAAGGRPAQAFCIWGFGDCGPPNPIVGEYTLDRNPSTTLTITAGKITSRTGPVSMSADYTIKSVDGKSVAIELVEPKESVQVQVEADLIKVRNTSLFAGDWRKKTAAR